MAELRRVKLGRASEQGGLMRRVRACVFVAVLVWLLVGGSAQAQAPKRIAPRVCCHGLLGDINGDGWVNALDFSVLNAAYGEAMHEAGYDRRADLTCDGRVDEDDLAVLQLQYWKRR